MTESKLGKKIIVWFRQDLRIKDNPAFFHAAQNGSVIPVFIYSLEAEGDWPLGSASKWWLHQSLNDLKASLEKRDGYLIFKKGSITTVLLELIKETKAQAVYWNRRYEPAAFLNDQNVSQQMVDQGIEVQTFNSALLIEPWEIKTKQNNPFKVFTPFWKAAEKHEVPQPLPMPHKIIFENPPRSLNINEFELEPKIDWAGGIRAVWNPGEESAYQKIKKFSMNKIERYVVDRDFPSLEGVSRISPHLHFGEISPRQIWHIINEHKNTGEYIRQLYWREFAYHLLFHFPFTANKPLRKKFEDFPWSNNKKHLITWQRGQTGYPIIDAGMRELWITGWMHNRIRLLVASFLTKDLMIPWIEGARWFWDTLLDADLASNSLGWQWTAGCGADAAPYFRIFNPVTQSIKFDPEGEYIRRWIPELKNMPNRWIHEPWNASEKVLENAKVSLGKTYPWPIINHDEARKKALEAFYENSDCGK